jgi:hypothetical protein
MCSTTRRRSWLAFVVAATLMSARLADAQFANASEVKAAFVYNFTKFTEWPANALPPASQLVVCVVGDDILARALAQITKGRPIDGHEMVVHALTGDSPATLCHVLYMSSLSARRMAQTLVALKGTPVLTLSDSNGFAQSGGVVELFVDGGNMRFAVNVEIVQQSQLHISSRLLSLAKITKTHVE